MIAKANATATRLKHKIPIAHVAFQVANAKNVLAHNVCVTKQTTVDAKNLALANKITYSKHKKGGIKFRLFY